MDFTSVIAPPVITAVSEHTASEHKRHEEAQKHSPLSSYELEVLENPHTFQRQLMQSMFGKSTPAAANGNAGENERPVTMIRRLTDTLKETFVGTDAK